MVERTLKIVSLIASIVLVVLAITFAFYIVRATRNAQLLNSALQKLEKADKDLDERLKAIQEQVGKIDARVAEVASLAEVLQKDEKLSRL
jgi:peptidoglycan hydrolase CwlO-like protein